MAVDYSKYHRLLDSSDQPSAPEALSPSGGGVDYSKYHALLDQYKPAHRAPTPDPNQNTSALGDVGTALKVGAQRVISEIPALLDIPIAGATGRTPFTSATSAIGELTGFQPGRFAEGAQQVYSPAQQAFLREGAEQAGFLNTLTHYASNPLRAAVQGVESIPGMALGGAYARALRGVQGLGTAARFGAGEGAVMAGSSMQEMLDDEVDPQRAAGFATLVGAGGGALGAAGGALSRRLGLTNPDELLGLGGRAVAREGVAPLGLARRITGGALAEGVLEEAPQSALETVLANIAAGRPAGEGVAEATAQGMVIGGLMGGALNIPGARRPRDTTQEAPPAPASVPTALEAALRTNTRPVQQWVDEQVGIGRTPAQTRKDAEAAFGGTVEPTIVLDEDGRVKTTTSAFEVYSFQNDFDARVEKQQNQPEPAAEDPALTGLRTSAPNAFRKDGALNAVAQRAWDAYNEFSDSEVVAAIEELAADTRTARWRVPMLEAIQRARQQGEQDAGVADGGGRVAGGVTDGGRGAVQPEAVGDGGVRPGVPAVGGEQTGTVAGPTRESLARVADTVVAAGSLPPLPRVQQSVVDYMLDQIRENNTDNIIDAKGDPRYEEIAKGMGLARGSVKVAVDGAIQRIADAQGVSVEEMKASLQARAARQRTTTPADADALGLSPAEQATELDLEDIFGEESGMGQISTIAGSQIETGEDPRATALAVARPDPVAERRAEEARQRREAALDQLLAMPEAAEAAEDWDAMRTKGAISSAELSRDDAVEWVLSYVQMKHGEITANELDTIQRELEATAVPATSPSLVSGGNALLEAPRADAAVAEPAPGDRGDVGDRAGQPEAAEGSPAVAEPADSAPEADQPTDPITRRVLALRALDLGERQTARLDRLIQRYQQGDIDISRLALELETLEMQAFPEDRGGQEIRRSRAERSRGTTIDAIWDAVGKVATPTGRRKIVVVQSADELVAEGLLDSEDAGVTQAFVDNKGTAYFIADHIDPGTELGVFLHEVGAHLGLENILTGKQYLSLVRQVVQWAETNTGLEGQIARRAVDRVDAAEVEGVEDNRAELIAYFIEEAVAAGVDPTALTYKTDIGRWFRTLWAAFKTALRRLDIVSAEKLTAQNVVDLAYGAAQLELNEDVAVRLRAGKAAFSYAGERASTANLSALQLAKTLQEGGWPSKHTRRGTGWFQAKDGMWRFEIDDSQARLLTSKFGLFRSDHKRLDQVLHHPDLFRAYPELREVTVGSVGFNYGVEGWYDENANFIALKNADTPAQQKALLETLVHEVQHAIQAIEGFARGGNTREWHSVNVDEWGRNAQQFWDDQFLNRSDALLDKLQEHGYESPGKFGVQRMFDALITGEDQAIKATKFLFRNNGNHFDATTESEIVEALGPLSEKITSSNRDRVVRARIQAIAEYIQNDKDAQALLSAYTAYKNLQSLSDEAFRKYTRLLGEVEARDVSARLTATAEDRRTQEPYTSQTIPDSEVIVRRQWEGGPGREGKTPAESRPLAQRFSKRAVSTPEGFLDVVRERVSDFFINPVGAIKEHGMGWLTLEQLADVVKSRAALRYRDAMVTMQKFSKDRVHDAAVIDADWAKLSENEQTRLSEVMRTATRKGFDPAEETAKGDEQTALALQYEGMSPTAKKIYTRVRDYYAQNYETRRQIMMEAANRAKASGQAGAEVDRLFAKVKGPYFPLMRVGGWYSVGMSPELAALMDKKEDGTATAAELKQIDKMRTDEAHYIARGHRSRREARLSERELRSTLGVARSNRAEEHIGREVATIPDLAKVEAYIAADLPVGVRTQVKEMMAQMYFDMLPDHSALKRQMKREGVHGEDTDMRRVFAASSISGAHHISRLKYANDLSSAMVDIRKDGRLGETQRMLSNELAKRTVLAMEAEHHPFVDRVMQASYFSHLGMSPAFILTNLTQVPMITAPWLGARHGFANASQALASAFTDTAQLVKATYEGKGWKDGWRAEFDWTSKFPEGTNEDKLFRDLLDRNLLDITMEHDLTAVAEMRSTKLDTAIKIANLPVRVSETMNRAVTGLATYRLGRANNMTHEQAVDYAAKALSETQLNYSGLNSARHMQSVLGSKALARLMMQFRKYQQGMVYLVAKNAYDAFAASDATAEEKRVARRTLAGLFGTTGIMAGALGLPFAGTVGFVVGLVGGAGGDADEPFETEVEFRNFLTDMLGAETAAVLAKGLPTLLDLDLSKRVGLGDIGSPLPFLRQGRTGTEQVGNVLAASAGASMATVASIYDGMSYLADGQYHKAGEKIVPIKAAQNLLRGWRYTDDGLTNVNGEVVVPAEKFSVWDITLRSMGFQPMREAEYYAANQAVEGAKRAAQDVRSRLLRKFAQARIRGEDTAGIDADIAEFNTRHPEKGVRIDVSSKVRAIAARRKLVQERDEAGVKSDRATRPFVAEGRFAAP